MVDRLPPQEESDIFNWIRTVLPLLDSDHIQQLLLQLFANLPQDKQIETHQFLAWISSIEAVTGTLVNADEVKDAFRQGEVYLSKVSGGKPPVRLQRIKDAYTGLEIAALPTDVLTQKFDTKYSGNDMRGAMYWMNNLFAKIGVIPRLRSMTVHRFLSSEKRDF